MAIMNPRGHKTVPFRVRNSAYAASGEAAIDFTDLLRMWTPETKLCGIGLRMDMTWASGGAGDTYDEPTLLKIFDRIQLTIPGAHKFYDMPAQAGPNIWKLMWAMTGKRPSSTPNGGTGQLGGGGGTTTLSCTNALAVRLFLYLPFCAFGALEEDDINVHLRDLIGGQLLVGFPNATSGGGGIWDTGADNQGISAGTLSAWADLGGQQDYVASSLFSITQHDLSGQEETLPFLNNRVLHFMLQVPTLAASVTTATGLTDANLDEININFGEQAWVERTDARQQIQRWNFIHARARDEELPHLEQAANAPFVPVFFPRRKNWKFTHSARGGRDVKYRVTGTATTPRLVAFYTSLNNSEALGARLGRNGAPVAEDFLKNPNPYITVKSATKDRLPAEADAAQRLPIKVRTTPAPASRRVA